MPAPSVLCLHSQAPLSMLESMQNLKIAYFMNREIEAPKSLVLRPRSFCSISLNLHQSQGREPTFIVCHIRDRHFLALPKLILVKSAECTWSSPFVLWVENQRHRAVMWFAWCTWLVRPAWLGQSYSQPVLSVTPLKPLTACTGNLLLSGGGEHREPSVQTWWCLMLLLVTCVFIGSVCSIFLPWARSQVDLCLCGQHFPWLKASVCWGGSSGLLVTNQIGIAVIMGLDK